MSNFKKMRLVTDDISLPIEHETNVSNIEKHQIPVTLSRLSDLDSEINQILHSKVDDVSKAKLYSQALRRFLIFKKLHKEETEIARQRDIQLLSKQLIPVTPKKKKSIKIKKPTIKKKFVKPQIKKTSTKQQIFSQPSTSQPKSTRSTGEGSTREKHILAPHLYMDVLNAYKASNPEIFANEESDEEFVDTNPSWQNYG